MKKIENGVNICTSIKCFKVIKINIHVNDTIDDRYVFRTKTRDKITAIIINSHMKKDILESVENRICTS